MFNEVQKYLASLPNGHESFPDYRCRADVYQFLYAEAEAVLKQHEWKKSVPAALHTPGVGPWRSEVHLSMLHCLLRDCFPDEKAYLAFAYAMNMKLFQTAFMRMVVAVVSPSLLVSGAAKRWGKIRQGSILTHGRFETQGDRTQVEVKLVSPDGLYPHAFKIALAKAYQAAADVTKGKDSTVTLASGGPNVTLFNVSWSR